MPNTKQTGIWTVITSSSVGTLIEWYDFYIFGSLATILSVQFFPQDNPTIAFLNTLLTFAAGFIVRPFGALVFGRLGDIVGRKYTFLVTLVLMGGSTFVIGLIPSFASIGYAAPILVLVMRLVQGLALGGEYGGAATYVAEHSPANKRGFYTSWIQTTATLGLFVSLVVILLTRTTMGEQAFRDWGWRVPFLLSSVLVGVSIFIRMKMHESPVFAKLKKEGKTSANPLKESFGRKENLKMVLLALFGAAMGQGVIWYTGQFYAMSFIQKTCNIDQVQVNYIIVLSLLLGTPFFVFFGWLSDKIGRKWIMLGGMLLGVLAYRPIYTEMYDIADLGKKTEITGMHKIEREITAFDDEPSKQLVTITSTHTYSDSTIVKEVTQEIEGKPYGSSVKGTVLSTSAFWKMVLLIFVQVLFVTMVYGPIAAFLVELFPTRIRYTSMSLPYHVGNGIFGGLTPAIATRFFEDSKTAANPSGDPLAGLTYVIIVAAVCFVIGAIYLKNHYDSE
ncbi:MFS transporter [Ravibacter arvi]|uniref:MFS transporter n=1 Tax=Ravibacter arvi TaxID=2051041 RepID=A0ABP8M9L3_9BACT